MDSFEPKTSDEMLLRSRESGLTLGSISRQEQLIYLFLAVGLLARCVRFFLRFPLWEDECFLCVNFIDRGYHDLLKPLNYQQVAPVLFLWIELTVVKLFGFNELSLRLFGFVCSIASMFLFWRIATRLLQGLPLVLAIGVFSVAYPGIRYAAEAKQYASDMLVGLTLLALAVEWWQAVDAARRQRLVWIISAFTPLAIAFSLPAVFAAGGVSLFMACVQIQSTMPSSPQTLHSLRESESPRSPMATTEWRNWFVFNLVLMTTVLLLFLLTSRDTNVAIMDRHWNYVFPPLTNPWKLPAWFFNIHTGELLAYPIGGSHGASTLTFICVVAAIVALCRDRRWSLLTLMLASGLLHMTASALQKYPYGGHVKFSQHMAGIICLMCGIGTAAMLSLLSQYQQTMRRAAAIAVVYLLGIGVASMTRDVLLPYKTESDMRARAFAEWFWFNAGFDGEVLCSRNDLGQNFCPKMYEELSWAAMYQCNRQIYSPHRGSIEEKLARVAADHPLRCVVYRDSRFEFDQDAFEQWLKQMTSRFQLVGTETFAFPRYAKREVECRTVDYVDEYKFVPRQVAIRSPSISAAARISE